MTGSLIAETKPLRVHDHHGAAGNGTGAATQGRRCCSTAIRDDNVGPALLREQQLRDDVAAEIGAQQQRWDDVADFQDQSTPRGIAARSRRVFRGRSLFRAIRGKRYVDGKPYVEI